MSPRRLENRDLCLRIKVPKEYPLYEPMAKIEIKVDFFLI